MAPETPRFLVDAMLGNVARDLRLLGYDAAFDSALSDSELLHLAQNERRTLVTRDGRLARRARGVECVLVCETNARLQVVEVLGALGLAASPEGPFSRCLACGARLRDLEPEEARVAVPDHVIATAARFLGCPGCARVYWPGTHLERLRERVREVLGSLHPPRARV